MRYLAAAALWLCACNQGEAHPAAPASAASGWPVAVVVPHGPASVYPRVVLVTIDTLRADHVSACGYRRKTMPFFDSLAERGVLFTRANSTVSHTAPSHASMLTGLPTLVHGVHHNGYRLDEDAVDLARVFAAAGFDTAACMNERFLERIAPSFREKYWSRGRGAEVVELARTWLTEEREGERFFLWMHVFDPHRWKNLVEVEGEPPFAGDPADFAHYVLELHGLDEQSLLAQSWETKDGKALKLKGLQQYMRFVDSYDMLVRYADSQLAALYRAVEALALPGPTLWIVTADHGEGLASHGHDTHIWNIYQEQLHVPLLFHASDGSLGPARVDAVVSHLDLFPTLVEMLGGRVDAPPGLLDGRSLWPLLRGEAGDWPERAVFAQRKPAPFAAGGPDAGGPLYALQSRRYKLLDRQEGADEFYDLELDPRELTSRTGGDGPERAELARALEQRVRVFQAHAQGLGEQEIPEELLRELKELGY